MNERTKRPWHWYMTIRFFYFIVLLASVSRINFPKTIIVKMLFHKFPKTHLHFHKIINIRHVSSSSTGLKVMEELHNHWKLGKAPVKFNFSKDVFDRHAIERPSDIALTFDYDSKHLESWSYSQLSKESIRSAIFLQNILPFETEKSPYILTILSRTPEWWFLHLAAIRIGSIFCPGTTMLTFEDIQYRLDASRAKLIITDETNMGKIDAACDSLPWDVQKVVVRSKASSEKPLKGNWIDFNKHVGQISNKELSNFKHAETKADETAQGYFTSGTTGSPKMVAHSHSSYGIGHFTTVRMLDLKENDLHWNISDPGWAKSSYSNFFAPFTIGSNVYINTMEKFEARKVLQALCTHPISTFCAPPTLYKSMIHEHEPSYFKFNALRTAVGAGEAVAPEVKRAWESKTNVPLYQAYGQTEMTAVDCCQTTEKEGSLGIPNGFLPLIVVDEDANPVPPNVEGQVALKLKPFRPLGLFKGYLKKGDQGPELDQEKNASVFVKDLYLTGDQAYVDETGHLFIVGRNDDVISSSGYRIGPTEIESVLQTFPGVIESAAVASPHADRGEVVKAFIILTPEYKKIAEEDEAKLIKEIQTYVKKHTAPYKYPRRIEFVNSLPKTVSGKILRRELKRAEYEKYKTTKS